MKDKTKVHPTKRQRDLSEEEIALWRKVTETVIPRKDAQLPTLGVLHQPEDVLADVPGNLASPPAQSPVHTGVKAAPQPHPPALAPLERRVRQKLSRGSLSPEASIDLHGLGQQEAYSALMRFLRDSQKKRLKLVLVVTGKGGRGEVRADAVGILKRAVPLWLTEPFYRTIIVGFEEAARAHGGAGALYVRIRRLDRGIEY